MLHHRQEFYMGVSHFHHIIHEFLRELLVTVVLLKAMLAPGTEMDFIDQHGLGVMIFSFFPVLPSLVIPCIAL
jgi:hypothetical protein